MNYEEYKHKDNYSLVIDYWNLDPQDPDYAHNKQTLIELMLGRFIAKAIEDQEETGRMTV